MQLQELGDKIEFLPWVWSQRPLRPDGVPKNERTDHIHDHKPKPNRHPNDPKATERQVGREPKRNELKKDFGI